MFEFEGRDVGAADDLVGCVHGPRCSVRLRVADLLFLFLVFIRSYIYIYICFEGYLDFEEILRRTVDFFKGLRASVRDGLHCVFFFRDSVGLGYEIVSSEKRSSREPDRSCAPGDQDCVRGFLEKKAGKADRIQKRVSDV